MSIDKVIVNTPGVEERLSIARNRKASIHAFADFIRQAVEPARTLIVSRAIQEGGLRVLQHLNLALAELDAEETTLWRTILGLEEQLAAEAAMKSAAKKGAKRVRK
jgi:hypothetical protein